MNKYLTFDDVLIKPVFSDIGSRKNVDLSTYICDIPMSLPVLSANMSTITEVEMAIAMNENGGLGVLHRFCSIEDNVKMAKELSGYQYIASIGIGENELERAKALYEAGARNFCIDVAHGAQLSVVKQYSLLREMFGNNIKIIVGNFATPESINMFNLKLDTHILPDAYKVGIGPGSVCTTRLKTGVGIPQFSAIKSCVSTGYNIIADGGMKTPGDIVKALAAGAKAVMLGGMLAGTEETPGKVIYNDGDHSYIDEDGKVQHSFSPESYKKVYKGSASENYANGWKTSEGIETTIDCKGTVNNILKDIEGGIRSAMTYVNARNLKELKNYVQFIEVSSATLIENRAHIKE